MFNTSVRNPLREAQSASDEVPLGRSGVLFGGWSPLGMTYLYEEPPFGARQRPARLIP